MPASAPRPVPTMIAVGVARPIAHGQAMTTTLMNAVSASVRRGSGPSAIQIDEGQRSPSARTIGTKTSAIRSASRWIGAFEPWARWTSSTIRARAVSRPTRVARMTNDAGRVERGADDLVAGPDRDRDRLAGEHRRVDGRARRRRPRHRPGSVSPGRTRSRSPTWTDSRATASATPSIPSRTRSAVVGLSADEPADRAGRPDLGARLQPASEQDEPDDDRRRVEVGLGGDARADRRRPARA